MMASSAKYRQDRKYQSESKWAIKAMNRFKPSKETWYIRVFLISRFTDISNISRVNAFKLVMSAPVSGALLGADGGIMRYVATC